MRDKLNINLVCLFKGLSHSTNTLELGGYVDAMLTEPYSLANAYIKSYAEIDSEINKLYNISLINLTDNHNTQDDSVQFDRSFINKIMNNNPDIIGFSTYCWNIDATIKIIKEIKKINKRVRIILGGRYALKSLLTKHREIDFIIRGEGEIPFVYLLKNQFKKGNIIKGVAYLHNGKLMDGGNGEIVYNIDDIPSPFIKKIIKPNKFNMMIELSRGCLNNCSYCSWNSNKHFRRHSYKRIYEELLYALNNGVKHITIIDSAINYNDNLLRDFTDAASDISIGSKIQFSYNLRYEHITEQQIKLLKRISSFQILLGLESINNNALHNANRSHFNPIKFEETIRILRSIGRPLVGIVLGLPGERLEDIKDTIYYLNYLHQKYNNAIGSVLISLLQVFPESGFDREINKYKIKFYKRGIPYMISNITWKKEDIILFKLWLQRFEKRCNLPIKGIEGEWRIN